MLALAVVAVMLAGTVTASAAPLLGPDLQTFAVLGGAAVSNTPTSTIVGNVGVSPGTAIMGLDFVPGGTTADPQVTGGLVHATTTEAGNAQNQLNIARVDLGLLGAGTLLTADLAGLTILPGVYTVPAGTSNLTGLVTLDGQGNANAAWVFEMESTLITSPGSMVKVINTGAGAGIYWNVASSATLDTTTSFEGNILALASITLNTGATIGCGRALVETGTVTIGMGTIDILCGADTGGEGSNGFSGGLTLATGTGREIPTFLPFAPTGSGPEVPSVPEPSSLLLLGAGVAALMLAVRRRSFANAPLR